MTPYTRMFLFIFCPCASNSDLLYYLFYMQSRIALLKFLLWFSLGNFFLFYVWEVKSTRLSVGPFLFVPLYFDWKGTWVFLDLVGQERLSLVVFFLSVPGCWCQMSWVREKPFFWCDRSLRVVIWWRGQLPTLFWGLTRQNDHIIGFNLLSFAPFLCHIVDHANISFLQLGW